MARGLVSGVFWGSVLAVMSLWLLSQIGGMVGLLSEPPRDVVVVAPAVGDPGLDAAPGDAPAAPAVQGSPATDPSRQGTGLIVANTDQAPLADTSAAQVPEASNVAAARPGPAQDAVQGAAAAVGTRIETPVTGGPVAALQAPGGDNPPVASTSATVPQATDLPGVAAQTPDIQDQTAGADLRQDSRPVVGSEPVQPPSPVPDLVPENDFSTPIVVATPPPTSAGAGGLRSGDGDVDAAGDTPAPPVTPGVAVVVNRGGNSQSGGDAGEIDEVSDTDAADSAPEFVPAIRKFAQEFDNQQGRPLMAIVLLPAASGGQVGLSGAVLPFPVSYVVDASGADATAIMEKIRASGNEVVLLAPLPTAATPKDVEIAFQTYMVAVPQAVAVMDVPGAAFQSGRGVATQVAEALAASGHGMVTYSRGLNAATQMAARAGVPAALVFRVFDGNDRDGAAIKRFLDQAAFRAAQQPGVILVGHNRPETITALLEWGLGNRASTVALAPLSVVLLAQ